MYNYESNFNPQRCIYFSVLCFSSLLLVNLFFEKSNCNDLYNTVDLFYVEGIAKDSGNIDLGQCLPASQDQIINCPILNFECWDQSAQSGAMLSPNFPNEVTNESFFGKVCKTILFKLHSHL